MNSEQNNRTDAFMSGKAFDITFRYIDDVLSINIPNKCKICKKQTYSLPHLLTYTSILTHMVNIQPVSVVKEITSILPLLIFHTWIVIYQSLPRMEFIFHNLFFTLKHAICIKTYACHLY